MARLGGIETSAVVLSIVCGAFGWFAAYVLIVGAESRTRLSEGFLTKRAWRHFSMLADKLGTSAPVRFLLRFPAWCAAADVLAHKTLKLQSSLGRESALAVMLLGCTAASVVCLFLSRSVLGVFVPVVILVAGVPLWDANCKRKKARQVAAEMPEVLRALALALSSGETLSQAIYYVGNHGRGPAARAFTRVSMRLRCGDSAAEALESLSEELDAPSVGLVVTALLISQRTGSPLRSLLQTSATLAERQGELERLLDVKTAQVRLSVRIVCLLPLVMIVMLSMISPDFQQGVGTVVGAVCVVVALAMDGCALLIVRKLMKGVL